MLNSVSFDLVAGHPAACLCLESACWTFGRHCRIGTSRHLLRERDFVKTAAIVLTLLVGSLASAAPLTPLTPADIQSRASQFQHVAWDGKTTNKSATQEDGCDMRTDTITVEDPITKTSRTYDLLVQAPPNQKGHPLPVVIIVPTIRGTQEYLEPQVARTFCENGFGSIIADVNDLKPTAPWPAWGGEDLSNRRSILALQTVVDFAQHIPRFDANRIGAMGLSLGGITTALWAGLDPRLKAVTVVVGGANLPYILSHSDEPNVADMRDKRMAAAGLTTIEQYDAALRSNVMFDPFYFAPQADKHRIFQVLAQSDTKVPYAVQKELFSAWGQPQSLTFTGGHVVTIIEVVYLYMGDVVDFFNDRMGKSPAFAEKPITHKVVNLDELGL